jgi:hypothetical protein
MFQLIYNTKHTCGELIQLSDYRFKSREDLKLNTEIKPLTLRCRNCWLEVDATYFEIWESERLGVKRIIEDTPIDQLNEECRKLTNL